MTTIGSTPSCDNEALYRRGLTTLIDDYLHASFEDDFVIAYAPSVRRAAVSLWQAIDHRGWRVAIMPMRPLQDSGLCQNLAAVVPTKRLNAGRCILFLMERDTVSHDGVVQRLFSQYRPDQYLPIHLTGAEDLLFTEGLAVPPEELAARNASILDYCVQSRDFQITTPSGTLLHATVDPLRYRWITASGLARPGSPLILPAGEVATFPATLSGVFVADFALHSNLTPPDDVRLSHAHVTVRIDDGNAVDFTCDRKDMRDYLEKVFNMPDGRRVGELGFGTHPMVRTPSFINLHLNERCPGIHLGVGRHNQPMDVVTYDCDVHMDLIARGGFIHGNGEALDLLNVPHHEHWRSRLAEREDLISAPIYDEDCCGIQLGVG